jgi:hypothetical protein
MPRERHRSAWLGSAAIALPAIAALVTWLTPLSFVPVPWPDDSAYYLVARDLFSWPPRFTMRSMAPFEPTYAIWNFNTMPLHPILIGLGRQVAIDGSFGLKLWSLGAWALTGALAVSVLVRRGLPLAAAFAVALAFALDPTLRWAAAIPRPEPLVGLFAIALVLGLSFGFPERFRARGRWWDPEAALLALAAYTHFNAIHLLAPVLCARIRQPRRLARIGLQTTGYLAPWILSVALHPVPFQRQMAMQWRRLAIGKGWLESAPLARRALFPELGTPQNLPVSVHWAGVAIFALIALAAAVVLAHIVRAVSARDATDLPEGSLVPAAGWVLGAVWLWHSKPEVWFTYYLHASVWTLAGVGLLALARRRAARMRIALAVGLAPVLALFAYADVDQLARTSASSSWRWPRYHALIDCVDAQLSRFDGDLGHPQPFRVWAPTPPDVLVELSRRHPHWELTRTNDFPEREDLAVAHGREVDAVVVAETIQPTERDADGPLDRYPGVRSVWMTWRGYFLHRLGEDAEWMPRRWLCQQGRWQAFVFMRGPITAEPATDR